MKNNNLKLFKRVKFQKIYKIAQPKPVHPKILERKTDIIAQIYKKIIKTVKFTKIVNV